MSGNDELGDMIAELTKLQEEHESLKAKVREMLIFLCTSNPRAEGERIYSELEELVK